MAKEKSMMSDDAILALIARVRHAHRRNPDIHTVCDQLEGRICKPRQAIEHLVGAKFRTDVKFDNRRYQRHLLRSPSERMGELRRLLERTKGGT
jgi:hypothetical protein